MPCAYCNSQFTLIRRKWTCTGCQKKHCSGCVVSGQCLACHSVYNTGFHRSQLMKVKVKHLQLFLSSRNHNTDTVREKHELVILIQRHFGIKEPDLGSHTESYETSHHSTVDPANCAGADETTENLNSGDTWANQGCRVSPEVSMETSENMETENFPPSFSNISPPTYQQTQNSFPTAETFSTEPSSSSSPTSAEAGTSSLPAKELPDISDLTSIQQIKLLNIRQLKHLLTTNLVNFKGILEKQELIKRVENLYAEHRNDFDLANEESSENFPGSKEANLCKICWDNAVNCVYLECGHMVTCIDCSKQVKECPICRQNIIRIVRVFKS